LLCVSSQPERRAVPAPQASARTTLGSVRRAASAIAGQNATRNIAAWAFGYEIGNARRAALKSSDASWVSVSLIATAIAREAIPNTSAAAASSRASAPRRTSSGTATAKT